MSVILQAGAENSEVLDNRRGRFYQLTCLVYGTAPVVFQTRDPSHSDDWVTVRQDGAPVEFTAAGDTYNVQLMPGFEYRVFTATPGAVVSISEKYP